MRRHFTIPQEYLAPRRPRDGRRLALVVLASAAVVLTGCREKRADSTPVAVTAAPEHPTFTRDIAPILFKNCVTCHRPGESAPFNLLTYDDARKKAKTIVEVTGSGYMPPWLPVAGYGEFDGERRLSGIEIETLRRWHAQGMREGEGKDLPALPRFTTGWQLGEPDLVVGLPESFVLPAEGRDVYRNFVVPIPVDAPRYVSAMEFRPDNPAVVHHAFMLIDTTSESRRLDAQDLEPGFEGMNVGAGAQSPQGHFISWQPGKVARRSPPGMAWRLAPRTDLVLQVHMKPSGKAERLDPKVGFCFTDQPPTRTPFKLVLTSDEIDIPAGEESWHFEQRFRLPVAVQVLGILPHAHYLGKQLHAFAILPDGSKRWLLRIDDWDFNWQGDYRYAEPVALPKGSVLVQHFTYDNSAKNPRNPHQPPQRVRRGTQTTDEMGELWFQLLPADQPDLKLLNRDVVRYTAERRAGELERRVAAGRASPHDLTELGRVLIPLGRTDDAIRWLRQSIAAEPRDAEAHYLLGFLLAQRNESEPAKRSLERAIDIRPEHAAALNGLGLLHLAGNDTGRAVDLFRQAAAADPQNPTPLTNLARALIAAGRSAEAQDVLQRALTLEPGHPAATRLSSQSQPP
jgi:tetratricopeptide (TPR) repeat protein